ncbi:Protein of unknown function (DUF3074) domain containing protein [Naviculisporaceae sp. PSN 640]
MALASLGPLIRLWGIKSDQLPSGRLVKVGAGFRAGGSIKDKDEDKSFDGDGNAHGNRDGLSHEEDQEGSGGGNSEDLSKFLCSLLKEAVPFIDYVAPKQRKEEEGEEGDDGIKTWKPKGSKAYNNNTIKVDLFERVISSKDLEEVAATSTATTTRSKARAEGGGGGGRETWICRRSIHEDRPENGTASWDEFRDCFKERHPETEALFTPSVVSMVKRVVWDCKGVPPQKVYNETYSNFTLSIIEARHRVGKPLKDRIFPILQMTCSAMDSSQPITTTAGTAQHNHDRNPQRVQEQKENREFLVISVTIPDYFDSDPSSDSLFRARGTLSKTGSGSETDTVIASYASIERIRQLDPSCGGAGVGNRKIEWLMALTSDAKGILSRWIQNLAVPGQIAKDVPLFLGWIEKEREGAK